MSTFKSKELLKLVLATGLSMILASSAYAQYVGPGNEKMPTSVSVVLKNPKDGENALIQGYLIKKIGPERYEFYDGEAVMIVDIEDRFFIDQRISEKTRVEIYGEINKEIMRAPEIEVKRLTIVKP